jgi:peptide/nickel transport system permease protein
MTTREAAALEELPSASRLRVYGAMLVRDKFALASALFLLLVVLAAVLGPLLLGKYATAMDLKMRLSPPFGLDRPWPFFLGADTLGRSIFARIVVASRNTVAVAGSAVLISMLAGSLFGLIAGMSRGWVATVIMRTADIVMSFPSLLLAVVVLYVFEPRVSNVVIVLAITRIPVYVRVVRAEVLEIRERMFVQAALVLGASKARIIRRHILPAVTPTLLTVSTLELAFMMLAESSLSFLGLGIQPPEVSWGLMVAEGRNYLIKAWWPAFWPGLAIMLTAVSLTLLSNWLRIATDPKQQWRLEAGAAGESA